jgi:hypothetical protein
MAFGELLKDFYRLAALDVSEAWAVQLLRPSFARYLARRSELRWTTSPGGTLVLPAGLAESLPATARRSLGVVPETEIRAGCVFEEHLGEDLLVAYQIT